MTRLEQRGAVAFAVVIIARCDRGLGTLLEDDIRLLDHGTP